MRKLRLEAGSRHYFTGEPCIRGHVALRLMRNGECVECKKQYARAYKRTHPQSRERKREQNRRYLVRYRAKPEYLERQRKKREAEAERRGNEILYGATRPKPDHCECCYAPGVDLVFDHDHTHGFFRGWICQACNKGIGFLKDHIVGVALALEYLERSNAGAVAWVEGYVSYLKQEQPG